MKKMFTLFLSLMTFSAIFAQYSNRDCNDNNTSYGNYDPNYRPDRAVSRQPGDDRWQRRDKMSDYDRRVAIDRVNRDYDRRIDDYRSNRRLNRWERDREIDHLKKEKAARLKNLGAGVLIGGVLGVLIGSQL